MNNPRLVVYVDDDEDDISIFKEALLEIDPNILFHSFTSGFDALEFLQAAAALPNYLFLDINMPQMSGKEILRYVKQDSRLQAIPVIMYSTSNYDQEVKEFYKDGAYGYLHKGTSLKAIKEDLSGILKFI